MAEQTSETEWLTDEQLRQWKSLMALMMALPPALDAQLKRDSGLNSFEYHVLARLSDQPAGKLRMSELSTYTQGSPSRLSHAVARLERAGWIERRSAEARCVNAHLTEAGRRKLAESAPAHVREVRRLVIDQLTAEQLDALGAAARLVVGQIEPGWRNAAQRDSAGDC